MDSLLLLLPLLPLHSWRLSSSSSCTGFRAALKRAWLVRTAAAAAAAAAVEEIVVGVVVVEEEEERERKSGRRNWD